MNKKISLLALALVFVLTLAACGGEKYEAQAINEETDVCVICKMAIKDDQFATQIITKDGQSLKFDDIGCLNTWKKENGTETIGAAFVRDFDSKQWLRYEKAYYAYDPTFQTPMAYGIVSFEKEEDAKAYIAEQGKGTLMSADDLASHSWAVNHEMMEMHGHDHSDDQGHGESDTHGQEEHGHVEESGTHDGGGHAS
ncbi:hypothetical protein B1748_14355 [Paenibacillus sp. MY03]|uniref:nitrous oxide reductase accessory protein NosL n=1 Tax=Paenibacillus sp. MY03 TaxID=302980 RepID=UPI000B3CB8D3|nr:nitrous oxide reductase accessory protein NosL [Paenibacillus sp. MY03]OUS75991.1 hypothetical protein B1748_14355 [Paenibacillus sp. MY03]